MFVGKVYRLNGMEYNDYQGKMDDYEREIH